MWKVVQNNWNGTMIGFRDFSGFNPFFSYAIFQNLKFTQIYLLLFQLPLLASTSGDILEVFLVKHSLVCNQLGRFSFSSKTFRSEDKNQRSTSPSRQQFFGQVTQVVSFLTAISHRGLRNCFFFWGRIYFFHLLFGLLFPFSLWTFISLFYLDFYSPFPVQLQPTISI